MALIWAWWLMRTECLLPWCTSEGVVRLDEGYQMLTNIVGVPIDALAVGAEVHTVFCGIGSGGMPLPYFTVGGS